MNGEAGCICGPNSNSAGCPVHGGGHAEPAYQIKMSTSYSNEFQDGFSEGYARAWQECWSHWIDKVAEAKIEYDKKENTSDESEVKK
jgi:hypothetical protein